jgi:ATP-binding cassette subfamily B protein
VDIRDLSISNWNEHIATLFQHFVRYQFSVKENIMLGKPELYDEQRMILAAKQSGAIEFIEKFDKGYDQMLGKQFEDGQELSGGQWQKLAIARAFYEQAPVLILDEPTSAIDAEAEQEIFENLLQVYTGKTLLLVSHRFSTVRNAEKIIVLDQGNIVESGTHADLMQNPKKYAKMFEAQAKGYR